MTTVNSPENLCPLCGQQNLCALAANKNASNCWCQSTEFTQQLLAAITPEQRNKMCVCQQCAEKALLLSKEIP